MPSRNEQNEDGANSPDGIALPARVPPLQQHGKGPHAEGQLRSTRGPVRQLGHVPRLAAPPGLPPLEAVAAVRLVEPPVGEVEVGEEADGEGQREGGAGVAGDERLGREGVPRGAEGGVQHGDVEEEPAAKGEALDERVADVEGPDDLPGEVEAERDEGHGRRVGLQGAPGHEDVRGQPEGHADGDAGRRGQDEPRRRGGRRDVGDGHGGGFSEADWRVGSVDERGEEEQVRRECRGEADADMVMLPSYGDGTWSMAIIVLELELPGTESFSILVQFPNPGSRGTQRIWEPATIGAPFCRRRQ